MQVHINLEVDNEMIEQSAKNAIKTKVREIMNQEFNTIIKEIIDEEIQEKVETLFGQALISEFHKAMNKKDEEK